MLEISWKDLLKNKVSFLFYNVFNSVLLLFCLPLGFCLGAEYGFLSFISVLLEFSRATLAFEAHWSYSDLGSLYWLINGGAGPGTAAAGWLSGYDCCRIASSLKFSWGWPEAIDTELQLYYQLANGDLESTSDSVYVSASSCVSGHVRPPSPFPLSLELWNHTALGKQGFSISLGEAHVIFSLVLRLGRAWYVRGGLCGCQQGCLTS